MCVCLHANLLYLQSTGSLPRDPFRDPFLPFLQAAGETSAREPQYCGLSKVGLGPAFCKAVCCPSLKPTSLHVVHLPPHIKCARPASFKQGVRYEGYRSCARCRKGTSRQHRNQSIPLNKASGPPIRESCIPTRLFVHRERCFRATLEPSSAPHFVSLRVTGRRGARSLAAQMLQHEMPWTGEGCQSDELPEAS